jgi:hypothetical protein
LVEVGFGEEREALADEELGGEGGVVDEEGHGGGAVVVEEGVGVVDVDFGGEECGADGDEGLAGAFGEFDGEEFGLGEGDAGGVEEFAAEVGMAADQADEGGVAGFLDGDGDDAADAFLEGADEGLKSADLVFEEDGELADAGGFEGRAVLGEGGEEVFHGFGECNESRGKDEGKGDATKKNKARR